jgi:hypothetical protein
MIKYINIHDSIAYLRYAINKYDTVSIYKMHFRHYIYNVYIYYNVSYLLTVCAFSLCTVIAASHSEAILSRSEMTLDAIT